MPTKNELESLESLLRKLPEEDQAEAFRILYGNMPEAMAIPDEAKALGEQHDFDVAAYRFAAAAEQGVDLRTAQAAGFDGVGELAKLP